MGPLFGVSCIECHQSYGEKMAWGVRTHMVWQHAYELIRTLAWLVYLLVCYHLYYYGL